MLNRDPDYLWKVETLASILNNGFTSSEYPEASERETVLCTVFMTRSQNLCKDPEEMIIP